MNHRSPFHPRAARSVLAAAAALALAGQAHAVNYSFSSGDYIPGVTSPNPLGPGDTLDIVGGGNKFFSAVAFTNLGTVNWGDSFYMQSGASISNGGLWLAVGDHAILNNGGATPVFSNSGIFRKTGSAGPTTIGNIAFVNSGVIDVQTGTLLLGGGDVTINAGSSFTGSGVTNVASNATFNGAFSSQNLMLSGTGFFTGNKAVVNGNAAFSSGYLAGSWEIAAGQQLTGVGGGNKFIYTGTLTNQGTLAWNTTDTLYMQSGGKLDNRASAIFNASASIANNGGATPAFVNSGTLTATAGNTVTVANVHFVNNGGTLKADGRVVFNGADAVFNAGTVFTGSGVNEVANAATFSGGFTSDNLRLTGAGVFSGDGAVLSGSVDFAGGYIGGSWQVAPGQTLRGVDGSSKIVYTGTLTNRGTIAWQTSDNLYMQSGGDLANQGLFVASASTGILYNGGTVPVFTNTGVVEVASGSTLGVGAVRFVNDGGTLRANGALDFSGGNVVFNAGSSFVGSGVTRITSNATFVDGFTSQNLRLDAGSFAGGDGSAGSKAVASGTVAFTGGSFTGQWQLAPGQTLTATDGASKLFLGAGFDNRGSIQWATAQPAYLQSGTVFDNRGSFSATQSTSLIYNGGAATAFNNHGVFSAADGSTLTVGNVGFVNQAGGTVQALGKGSVVFAGGDAVFLDGTVFAGTGTVHINSNAGFVGGYSGDNLFINGGTASGSAAVVHGRTTFTGGVLSGTWQVAAGQTLAGADGGGKSVTAGTLDNRGTVSWNTSNPLHLQSGGQVDNHGVFVAAVGTSVVYNGGQATQFNNHGVLRAAAGATLDIGSVGYVNRAGGSVDALGSVNFNGGDAVFQGGSAFTGSGRVHINSNASFTGGYSGSNLYINAGTSTGGDAVVGGTTHFTGGALAGSWSVPAGQQIVLENGGAKVLLGASVANAGTLAFTDAVPLHLQSGASLANSGVIDFASDGHILYSGGAQVALVNTGLIVKSAGNGTSSIGDTTGFVNQGVVDVQTGTLQLPSNFANDGVMTGSGTYLVPGTLANAGHLAPGAVAGTLALSGNYTQTAAGFFDVDVTSAAVHDLFDVSGSVLLDGTLALSCLGDCTMAVGTEFVVLDYSGQRSGSFASLTLAGFSSGGFETIYDDANTRVLLRVVDATLPVPEPEGWALMLGGLGFMGWLARRRRPAVHASYGA